MVNYSARPLSGDNYLGAIILVGNCPENNCPGAIARGQLSGGEQLSREQLSGGQLPCSR